jgi:hypothetical protein
LNWARSSRRTAKAVFPANGRKTSRRRCLLTFF